MLFSTFFEKKSYFQTSQGDQRDVNYRNYYFKIAAPQLYFSVQSVNQAFPLSRAAFAPCS